MDTRIYFNNTLDTVKKLIFIFLLMNVALCLFTLIKSSMSFFDSIILYSLTMIWSVIFIVCVVKFKKEWVTGLLIVFMIEAGVMFQSIMIPDGATKIPLFLFAGTFAGLAFILFQRLFYKFHERFHYVYEILSLLGVVGCFGLLLTIGYDPNGSGVALWIRIGGFTLQLSEFMKLFLLMFFSSMFSNQMDMNKKFIVNTVVLLLSCGLFAILNELGTILILILVYSIACFIYYPHKYALYNLLFMVALLAIGTLVIVVERCFLTDQLGKISVLCSKLAERVLAVINPEAGRYTYAYQITQGKEGIVLGGMFGSKLSPQNLFAKESDMAIAALCNNCGLVCTLLLMFFYAVCAFLNLKLISSREKLNQLHQVQNVLFILTFTVQSFYCGFANLGFLPLTGIPIPFLSYGGSAYIITLVYFFSILFLDNNYKEGRKRYES